jgi:aminobenzoyl-glutamate utilization protein B
LVDLFTNPALLTQAKDYFTNVQTKDQKYIPFISAKDPPPVYLNKEIMDKHRDKMKAFYYDPTKYGTYLEQLGIKYPTLSPQ